MTSPAPETLEREKDKLFVTDIELLRRLGIPVRKGRVALLMLDNDPRSGFPRKQKLWGDRRYWPAVKAYFERESALVRAPDAARLIPENPARTGLPRRSFADAPRGGSNVRTPSH